MAASCVASARPRPPPPNRLAGHRGGSRSRARRREIDAPVIEGDVAHAYAQPVAEPEGSSRAATDHPVPGRIAREVILPERGNGQEAVDLQTLELHAEADGDHAGP